MADIKVGRKAVFIVALGALFYVYEFFLRVAPGALTHELMRDLNLNAFSLGVMSACFFYAYAPLQIPAGLICDSIGPKKALTYAVAICGMATVVFSTSHLAWQGSIARFFMGGAASLAFVGPLALASRWLPQKHFAMAAGGIQLMGALGALIGGGPIAAASMHYGWRNSLMAVGFIGLILMLIFGLFLKDSPKPEKRTKKLVPMMHETWKNLLDFCCNKQVWAIGLASFACWAPMAIFAELWGGPFLASAYHLKSVTASSDISWVWIAVAIGSPLGGWWSDKIGKRCMPLVVFYSVGFIASLMLIYCHFPNQFSLCLALFMFGLTSAAQPITFGLIADIAPKNIMGAAVGFNNMCVIAGATILQPLVGYILQTNWHHKMLDNAPFYQLSNYQHALLVLPIVSLIGIISAKFLIKETDCKDYTAEAAV